jgi:IS30 family transposase
MAPEMSSNANGRLRRWLPRHTDIDRLSDEEIQDIVITNPDHVAEG